MDITLASDDELEREELRILNQAAAVREEAIVVQRESMRFRRGPEADRTGFERHYRRYVALCDEHTRLYDMFMQIHQELQQRGR